MIGYKGFDKDLRCRGFQYEIGKTYEMDGEIELCERGFHFCENISDCFAYYPIKSFARYAKIEAIGDVIQSNDNHKGVTNKIRILEEIPRDEAIKMSNSGCCNTGDYNTGNYNSGNCNSGNCNTGDCNTGDWNTGDWNTGRWNSGKRNSGNGNSGNCNTGDCNSGNCNTGDWNTGDWNTGDWNTGRWNSGKCNSGNCNTGDCNTGDCNTGDWNTGRWNSGNCNTGDWNKSSYNNGCFMSVIPDIMMFNKPTDWTIVDWWNSRARGIMLNCPIDYTDSLWISSSLMTDEEREAHPEHKTTGGYLKTERHEANRQAWWDGLSLDDKQTVMSLPNFDPDVFYECTGIRVKMEGAE